MSLVLGAIPQDLSEKLIVEYLEVKKRYALDDWGVGELKGGRFAEVVLRIYQHLLGWRVIPFGIEIPSNEKEKIFNTIASNPGIEAHVRQKTVPLVRLLLNFRNNRDAGHLGGFDANGMDTMFVISAATWVLAEFVRVYGGYSMPGAQKVVEGLTFKELPVMMEHEGEVFIVRPDLKSREEVLVLLYKHQKASFDFLFSKTHDKNRTRFKSILNTMIKSKHIGFSNENYFLMPVGTTEVEKKGLLKFSP